MKKITDREFLFLCIGLALGTVIGCLLIINDIPYTIIGK